MSTTNLEESNITDIVTNKPNIFSHIKFEHLIAGVSGGLASTLIVHPLDLIKIRFAVNDGRNITNELQYKGITNAFITIFNKEGLRGLYRGVTPSLWGAGSSWGLYFLFYNSMKRWVQEGNVNKPLNPGSHLLLASQAGMLTLLLTNPIWVVKTRLCLQYSHKNTYNGMIDALQKIYAKEGVRGYYKGFVPGLFGTSHGAIQFMVYEEMKNKYNEYKNVPITTKLSNAEYLFCAAVSKIIAVCTTYPYQVVRARLQNQYYSYDGFTDCIKQTWKYEKWKGFYKGLGPNLLRVTPATMVTFVTYENIVHLLQKKA